MIFEDCMIMEEYLEKEGFLFNFSMGVNENHQKFLDFA